MTTATRTHVPGVSGRPPSQLPPPAAVADAPLAALLDEYEQMTTARRQADREAAAARDGGPAARRLDERDQGAAMRDGRADPGPSHERQRMAALEAARSKIASTDAARLQVARDVQVRRLEVQAELMADLDGRRAELDATVGDALATLAAAIETAKEIRQLRVWTEPRTLDIYSPPRPGRGDPAVQLGHGSALEPKQVFAALAAMFHG